MFVYAHMLLTCLVCVSVLIMLGHSLLILCVCESGGDRRVCLCAHASNLPRVRQCAYYARTLPPYFVCVRVVGIDVYVYAHMRLTYLVCVCVSVCLLCLDTPSLFCVCVCESGGDRRVCLGAHASNFPRVCQCAYYARTTPSLFCVCTLCRFPVACVSGCLLAFRSFVSVLSSFVSELSSFVLSSFVSVLSSFCLCVELLLTLC